MVFSSISFLFYFLPVFLLIYLIIPAYRNPILLFSSLAFYAWGEPFYILLMVCSIVCNYFAGVLVFRETRPPYRRLFLILGISVNIAVLFFFKYAGFVCQILGNGVTVPHSIGRIFSDLPLPLGVSFFTFQGLSYLIDIFRREIDAERDFTRLATYISMFPQLVAGPIVRFSSVREALYQRTISFEHIADGISLFIIGLSSKVLIANTLALPADRIFSTPPETLTIGAAWFGVFCYSLQIYYDFAGYSIMAIGLGKILGFEFPPNFDSPYVAQSVTEFWRRWHMTLSSWFRDYLYIPLGGNRRGKFTTYRNLVVVFLLCGAWHGANWTFIIWGLYHGAFLMVERVFARHTLAFWRPLRHLYLIFTIAMGWVIFRSEDLGYALRFFLRLLGVLPSDTPFYILNYFGSNPIYMVFVMGIIAATMNLRILSQVFRSLNLPPGLCNSRNPLAYLFLFLLFFLNILNLASGTHNPFIYFRF